MTTPDYKYPFRDEAPEAFNKLSPAEAERLAHLIEELSEAQKAACKILRHGYESLNPHDSDHLGNRADLRSELNDVLGAIRRMVAQGDIPRTADDAAWKSQEKSNRYMHHNN